MPSFLRYPLFLTLFLAIKLWAVPPSMVYLTWTGDPTTTMVVQWVEESTGSTMRVHSKGAAEWVGYTPVSTPVDGTKMYVKRVYLEGLEPGTDYGFEIIQKGPKGEELSKEYLFQTMPTNLQNPVKFVVGGDVYFHYELFRKMNAVVAKLSPDFVVLGGDIAYVYASNPLYKQVDWQWKRWETFLQTWTEQMIDEEGRLIPFLIVVGNHDVKGRISQGKNRKLSNVLFYTLFPFSDENRTYREISFGDYFSLFLLDTGHSYPMEGAQIDWLARELKAAQNYPYKMAVYHVPAYPSRNKSVPRQSQRVQKNWTPLFDEFGIQAAFENHNHTYKRTNPIRAGKIDEDGVTYFGDGSWGVSTRRVKTPVKDKLFAKTGTMNAVFLVTLTKEQASVVGIDNKGKIIDEAPPIRPKQQKI